MKYARIADGCVADVAIADTPEQFAEMFHPDLAAQFIPVADEVQPGWRVDDGTPVEPVPVQPTADDLLRTRLWQTKAECSRRIYAVANAPAQINAAGAAGCGALSAAQLAVLRSGLDWINQMRTKAVQLAQGTDDYTLDDAWPPCPPAVAELMRQF